MPCPCVQALIPSPSHTRHDEQRPCPGNAVRVALPAALLLQLQLFAAAAQVNPLSQVIRFPLPFSSADRCRT